MNISKIMADSLSFPFSNPVRFFTLGFILIFSPLILPMILAGGYLMRIIKNTSQGLREMPPFEDLTNMFIDGLKFLAVNIIYSLPGSIFISAAFMIAIFNSFSTLFTDPTAYQPMTMYSGSFFTPDYQTLFQDPFTFALLAIGILLVALGYLIQMIALPRMVYKNKVGAALEFKAIYNEIKILGWENYLIGGIFFLFILGLTTLLGFGLPGLLNSYGVSGYIISLIIIGLFISSFEYAFQGRFMGLIYPGELENPSEDETKKPYTRKPRFSK